MTDSKSKLKIASLRNKATMRVVYTLVQELELTLNIGDSLSCRQLMNLLARLDTIVKKQIALQKKN